MEMEVLGFSVHEIITIVTVLSMFTILLFTKLRTDLVFLGTMAVIYLTGVLDAGEAFSGFSNTSVIVIGVLFVVVAGMTHTGVLQWIVKHLMGQPNTYTKAVLRLMLPVAALSSFLSNTTVVAMFVDIVKMWSKKLNISPSKLLIPLSYASGMGGICTLIGTPPNLIISGLYANHTGHTMNIMATTIPGLFCLFIGVLSIIALRRLLPDRKAPESDFEATTDYTVELLVPSDNPYIGKTIAESNLNDVHGGHLIELIHYDAVISPVPDDEVLMGGDRLVFAGQVDEILDLKESHQLVNADHHVFSMKEIDKKRQLQTAFVSFGSPLIGKNINSSDFEKKNNMVLVAVSRQGTRINESPREVVLQPGDTLLLECPRHVDFNKDTLKSQLYFFDSMAVANFSSKTFISVAIMIAMVVLSAKTGLAEQLAFGILDVCGTNPIVVMTAICFVGTFATEFISNTAAGAMFFPIMYETAEELGYEPFPFLIALMISVSSSFATPIGSPTHMLVYGPGGYRFSDFLRIGLLMNLIILAANIIIVNLVYPLTPLAS